MGVTSAPIVVHRPTHSGGRRAPCTAAAGTRSSAPPTATWFVGRIDQRTDAGDHVGFVLDPVQCGEHKDSADRPRLRLPDALFIDPGHPVD
jgi:hypothetical protein